MSTAPGEPPRTSTAPTARFGKRKMVRPVGPSSYEPTPISTAGQSNWRTGPWISVSAFRSLVQSLPACWKNFAVPVTKDRRAGRIFSSLAWVEIVEELSARQSFRVEGCASPDGYLPTTAALNTFAELDAHNCLGIVETCRRLTIPIRDYLGSVLPGLADRPISQTAELTPAAWANRNASPPPPISSAV